MAPELVTTIEEGFPHIGQSIRLCPRCSEALEWERVGEGFASACQNCRTVWTWRGATPVLVGERLPADAVRIMGHLLAG